MVPGPDAGEGELRLHGSAAPPGPELRATATCAWWSGHPEQAAVFLLGLATALFIEWDLEHGVMTTTIGTRETAATTAPAATREPPPAVAQPGRVPLPGGTRRRARIWLLCFGWPPRFWPRGLSGPGPAAARRSWPRWPAAGR
jgi:hypothetical protein